jgi:hypothetical protein
MSRGQIAIGKMAAVRVCREMIHGAPRSRRQMLNLAKVFSDAIVALGRDSEFLQTGPLPATIFLMQRDVINHYRYALTHYFGLSLDEGFLQNSSLGPPYAKWAKFTNDDFAMLSFAVHNLLRYTSRFIHETECARLVKAERFSERAVRSNSYTNPICDVKFRQRSIGIRIEADHVLVKTPFAPRPYFEGKFVNQSDGNETVIRHITTDSNGFEKVDILTQAEYWELTQTLREYRYDISDRTVITTFTTDGMSETDLLVDHNNAFGDMVNRYYQDRTVATEFDAKNESWWV